MALRIRKDIKKSSYYVWFLGAKESKGLRGKEFILPVIEHLVQREKDIEPFKVTLQVSHKGLKIIQTVLSTNTKTSKPKNETIKHFIPHNTITCVYQDEDIVSCILLLFNPVTKCPLHVHVYRCDSVETATHLKGQLEILIERPENQKKFSDLENKVKVPNSKDKKKFDSSLGSDTGTSTRESESSEERYSSGENKITSLYDSLAAELRQKLGNTEAPILLPPRDYDTVHRQKGNLQGIDLRRCLTSTIVGQNAKGGRRIESSGGSSGIGSDHAPSPDNPDSPDRYNMLDNQSTSDEEWNAEPNDSSMYLMHSASEMILPRASRHADSAKFSPEPPKSPDYRPDVRFNRYADTDSKYHEKPAKEHVKYAENSKKYERYETNGSEKEIGFMENSKYHGRYHEDVQKYPPKYEHEPRRVETTRYPEKYGENGYKNDNKYRSSRYHDDFDEEIEYREKRSNNDEPLRARNKYNQDDIKYYGEDMKSERSSRSKYDDYYTQTDPKGRFYDSEVHREKLRSKYPSEDPRYYPEYDEKSRPSVDFYDSQKQKYQEDRHYYQDTKTLEKNAKTKFNPEDPRFYTDSRHSEKSSRSKYSQEESPKARYSPEDYFEDVSEPRRRPEDRQRSPTPPEINVSPRDRFKDAKEKFLLLERERLEEQERLRRQDLHNSTPNLKDKTFLKRHESMVHPKERFHDERRFEMENRYQPKPAPRTIVEEEVRYRREVPLGRYRSPERYDKNRRSMFSQIEEEHKKNSNEIAKELKRRSYMESNFEKDYYREKNYGDVPDGKRYPGMEREPYQFSKSNVELDKVGDKYSSKQQKLKQPAGYRHSYAEPKLSLEKIGKKHFPELVHRTNSSVSNSGRVGIASVTPY